MRLESRVRRLERLAAGRPDPRFAIQLLGDQLAKAWGEEGDTEDSLPESSSWKGFTRTLADHVSELWTSVESPGTSPLERLVAAAREAGCTLGQLSRFLRGGYIPQRRQLLFHAATKEADRPEGPTQIGFGGARGPGKSHATFAQVTLDDCQWFPGLKVLLLRKVGKALRESAGDLRQKILQHTPHKYHLSTGQITFPNGSRVILGHFKNEADIDAYVGLEYDLIAVEEATTLSSLKFDLITTCCRTGKRGWRPRMYSNANPGGIGHAFYKHRFIDPAQSGTESETRFIFSTVDDNVFVDPAYKRNLERLTGWLRQAWRFGDWNIHAGTYFGNLSVGLHKIEPHQVRGRGYLFYLVLDYGFAHPTAALLLAQDGSDVLVVDEYRARKRLTPEHSRALDAMLRKWELERRHLRAFVIGQDAWRRGKDGTTIAEEYETLGWTPEPAIMHRVQGAQELLRRLGDEDAGVRPSIWFFSNCTQTLNQLPQMQHDPRCPEDVLKVDADEEGVGGDDLYDALRYGLQAVAADLGPLEYGPLAFRR